MKLKDYYKTLRIEPAATDNQVKKSFRQLAHLYHPDKNPGNASAEAIFREIKEAYEILGDPQKREEYNYKRWYSRTIKDSFAEELHTPEGIVRETMRLNEYLQTVNTLRIDFDGLSHHIRQLLNESNLSILKQAADDRRNRQIVQNLLRPASMLPYAYIAPIATLLLELAGTNEGLLNEIGVFVKEQQQKNTWQKYKMLFVFILTLFICWIIYMVST